MQPPGPDGAKGEPPWPLIATYNGSGWQAVKTFLETTSALVVLGQEAHVVDSFRAEASQALAFLGWKALFAPAYLGPAGRPCAGTFVAVRSWIGLSVPMGLAGPTVVEHRAVWGKIEIPGLEPFVAISAYLHDSVGLARCNLDVLSEIGAAATAVAMPFLIGADFNMEPGLLGRTSFVEDRAATVVADSEDSGACRSASGFFRNIDFFVASLALARRVVACRVCRTTPPNPHLPLLLQLQGCVDWSYLGLAAPPRLPTRRLTGPLPPPPPWEQERAHAEAILAGSGPTPHDLDTIYFGWAQKAEGELISATGASIKRGFRGQKIKTRRAKWGLGVPRQSRWASSACRSSS